MMSAMARTMKTAAALAVSALLAGCGDPPPLYVDGAYVRLSPNPDNPSAGYFTIHGGAQDVTLRSVETDAANRLEMHESRMDGGVMKMTPLDRVDVPARSSVAFAPGGKHLMIWTINPQAIAAGKIGLKLTFSSGERILVDAVVQSPDGTPTGDARDAPTAGADDVHTEVH